MKEFITGVESTPQRETGSKEEIANPAVHSDPKVIKKLLEDAGKRGEEGLEKLQLETPQTVKQEETKGFLTRIGEKLKSLTAGKELSPKEQLNADIRSLNYLQKAEGGLGGGLASFFSGGFGNDLSIYAEKYNIEPEKAISIINLMKQIDRMKEDDPELKTLKLQLREEKLAFTRLMNINFEKMNP